jgi:serine/threonine protein kinase
VIRVLADGHGPEELAGSLAGDVLALVGEVRPERWDVRLDEGWCHLAPPGHVRRNQGWKLHVSATPLSAPAMLSRVVPVLLARRCAFKFARSVERVEQLVAPWCEREAGGKVLTVHPGDDGQFLRLAGELHELTEGLAGPPVLSDRAYCPGSVVSFRFGGFVACRVLADSGTYEPVLVSPEGRWVPDRRVPWFSPPKWAVCPVPADDARGGGLGPGASGAGLLGGRYKVREAIRHSYRGGVYRGTDVRAGEPVVIKHARPHVGADRTGQDCRDRLRREGGMLDRLGPADVAPRKRDMLDQSGHVFLVEDEVPGLSLRQWAEEAVRAGEHGCAPAGEMAALALRVVRLVQAVHALGLGIRDLNPANVIVDGDRLWLIDVEAVSAPGEPGRRYLTPGYAAPEQCTATSYGPAPPLSADLYSLGATLLYLCTGMDPALPDDDPPERPAGQRLAALADLAAAQSPQAAKLAPLIRGMVEDDPAERWSLDDAAGFLDRLTGADLARTPTVPRSAGQAGREHAMLDGLIDDGIGYLRDTATPDLPRLWPPAPQQHDADPCAVANGAGGVLAVLTRAATLGAGSGLRPLVASAAAWLERRLADEPRTLPGLYYGRTGTAWAWHDAARYLDDKEMAGRALALLARAPVSWDRPGIADGLAGAGLATVHLWQCTDDQQLAERIQAYAEAVLAAAERDDAGPRWLIAPGCRAQRKPSGCYGFAQGAAGIGTFLLAAGHALGDRTAAQAAHACGQALCQAAVTIEGGAWWPLGDQDQAIPGGYWCSESPGVGSFLIRLWSHTADRQFLDTAVLAAVGAYRERWTYSPAALADTGEFLLDMATATGEYRYREQARALAACIAAHGTRRAGYLVSPDDTLRDVHAGYLTGLAGVLGFLLRLRHGGPRLWRSSPDGDHHSVPPPGQDPIAGRR